MPSTHLSLHYHVVFGTKGREPWIAQAWRDRLHAYLGGVIFRALRHGGVQEAGATLEFRIAKKPGSAISNSSRAKL